MKKESFFRFSRVQRILILIAAIAAVLLVATILMILIYAFGPISHPGEYRYEITVTGLGGFTGNNLTRITVPFPGKENREPVFRDSDIDNRTFGIWTSRIVSTAEGPMVQFSTRKEDLDDIHAIFYRSEEGPMAKTRELAEKMYPDAGNAETPYTRWIYNQSAPEGPVTSVIIDPGIGLRGEPISLTFDLSFQAGGGVVSSQERDWYRLSVVEEIPGGVTGSIPVRVQIGKYESNRWISFVPSG